jgi:DNA-binding SARP family transcriptional activator
MLNLYVLGRIGLFTNQQPLPLPPLSFNLLAYLALHRQELHSYPKLANVLWPDCCEATARVRLNSALHRLRCQLPRGGTRLLARTREGGVGVHPDAPLTVDCEEFLKALRPMVSPASADLDDDGARELETALELYRGELLEGCDAEWSILLRERLRNAYIRTLTRLIEHHADRDNLDRAISLAETAVATDPLREPMQQRLIELYRESGERALALRQFRQLEGLLARDLGVAPLAETRALVDDLLRPAERPH